MNTQTIFLLGGFGFIGTNLLKTADQYHLPYRFVVFDRFEAHPAGLSFECIDQVYAGDFADTQLLEKVFDEHKIDIVFHAISSTVPLAVGSTSYDVMSNVMPTLALLDCMVKHGVQKMVFLSSGGAVYGESEGGHPHKETDELYPKSSYGVVKLAIEKYLFLYQHLYGLRPLVLRLSNPYGHYHYSSKQGIINIALRKAQQHQPFTVWGDGSATKDYIFVEDVCEVVYRLLKQECYEQVVNVGSGERLSVRQILQAIQQLYPDFKVSYQAGNESDVKCVNLSTERLQALCPLQMHTFEQVLPLLNSEKV